MTNDIDRARAFKMPFGKHRGIALSEIPNDYLEWASKTLTDGKVVAMCKLVLEGDAPKEPEIDEIPF